MENSDIKIALPTGEWVIVSPEDADLAMFRWFRGGSERRWFVQGYNGNNDSRTRKMVQMSRVILERMIGRPLEKGEECDHINKDTLDNRRCNLRLSTRSLNNQNRRGWGKNGKGVYYNKKNGKYTSHIVLGSFDTAEEAAQAWRNAASLLRIE